MKGNGNAFLFDDLCFYCRFLFRRFAVFGEITAMYDQQFKAAALQAASEVGVVLAANIGNLLLENENYN